MKVEGFLRCVFWSLAVAVMMAVLGGPSSAMGQYTTELVRSASTPRRFDVNSNRLVAGAGGIHHVLVVDQMLRHFYSQNTGGSWVQSGSVAPLRAESPTLAVDDDGNVGLAFISPGSFPGRGNLYFSYWDRWLATWSTPVAIDTSGLASSPAIAGYGSKMHVVWSVGFEVRYASVVTTAPVAPNQVEYVMMGTVCGGVEFRLPSIAVVGSIQSPTRPVIQVALGFQAGSGCGAGGMAGVYVVERPDRETVFSWTGFPGDGGIVLYRELQGAGAQVGGVSLAANGVRKYFLLAYSFGRDVPGGWVSKLFRIFESDSGLAANEKTLADMNGVNLRRTYDVGVPVDDADSYVLGWYEPSDVGVDRITFFFRYKWPIGGVSRIAKTFYVMGPHLAGEMGVADAVNFVGFDPVAGVHRRLYGIMTRLCAVGGSEVCVESVYDQGAQPPL
ncbi:hypothetical protein [Myxococcus landrumensis]|uniref:Lipoprotein n=1 Tax=Myxococcus landrumensis TaxID=2813577 RepID=A0ABX7NB76_9BACT|nr:hypothetical protein [Myxococcus landrumus]QSQ14857.1 hypothetical protein JY572_01835 [Myxococcus landrumus]